MTERKTKAFRRLFSAVVLLEIIYPKKAFLLHLILFKLNTDLFSKLCDILLKFCAVLKVA